jgi:hypothetical protein
VWFMNAQRRSARAVPGSVTIVPTSQTLAYGRAHFGSAWAMLCAVSPHADARNSDYVFALVFNRNLGGRPVSRPYTVAGKWAPRFLHGRGARLWPDEDHAMKKKASKRELIAPRGDKPLQLTWGPPASAPFVFCFSCSLDALEGCGIDISALQN